MSDIDDELHFLRFFYEQAIIEPQDRAFIEEGYELCFNKKVPSKYKFEKERYILRSAEPPITQKDLDIIFYETEDNSIEPPRSVTLPSFTSQSPTIPGPPNIPEEFKNLTLKELLLDKAESGEYALFHKKSGEHVSLSILIAQLKAMTNK